MSRARTVKLLPEIDARLVRYAELRGRKPEEVAAEAIERHLKEAADLQLRIADARRAHEREHGRG
jgi:predicted transcriptional regulator